VNQINRRSLVKGASAAAVLAGVSVALNVFAQGKKPIRVGMIFPITGPLALLGETQMAGAQIAIDIINQEGGVNGRKIEVVKADAPNSQAAIAEANRLIGNENVKIVLGTYASGLASSIVGIAERSNVIHWEVGGVADSLTQRGFKNVFRIPPPASLQGMMALEFINEVIAPKCGLNKSTLRLGVVHEDSEFGSTVAKALAERSKVEGIKFTAYSYAKDSNDLTPIILRLRQDAVDVIVSVQYVNDAILFWRQAKQLNLALKGHVALGGGHFERSFIDAVGKDANGLFIVPPPVEINPAGLDATAQKDLAAFNKAFAAQYKKSPSSITMLGFAGTMVLLRDVLPKAADPENPDAIRAAALSVDKPIGSTAAGWGVKFRPPGENGGQNERAFWIVRQWQGDDLHTVYPVKLALRQPNQMPLPAWGSRS
jgi:branched-chain amino acid transport system substrate-binding protein